MDGPGKAKRFCPQCKHINHVKVKLCKNCEYDFSAKRANTLENTEAKPPKPTEQLEIRKGNKGNKVVIEAATNKKTLLIPPEYYEYEIKSTVRAPSGYCPVPLKRNPLRTADDVVDWARKVRIYFLETNKSFLMNTALDYYLRYTFDVFGDEYKELSGYLKQVPDLTFHENLESAEICNAEQHSVLV